MAFYIMPPQDDIAFDILMDDTRTRLTYLCELSHQWGDEEKIKKIISNNPEVASNTDSLTAGTKRDNESYFILKLASLSNGSFRVFLSKAEGLYFEHRLIHGGHQGGHSAMHRALTKAVRDCSVALHSWVTAKNQWDMTLMTRILQTIIKRGMSDCQDREQCSHFIKVPFTFACPLVSTRSVELTNGLAKVECHQVVVVLRSIFDNLTALVDEQLEAVGAEAIAWDDNRLAVVMEMLQGLFKTRWLGNSIRPLHSLKHEELERESTYFPACMKVLFRKLQQHNRLRHNERFRFTVFLKDIGLPLEENIAFWETYYSKHPGGGCDHSWSMHRNRYIYSIRHIYGLEGMRRVRSSHSCSALQNIKPDSQDIGGCPFSCDNSEEQQPYLVSQLKTHKNIQEVITKDVKASRPWSACQTLMAFTIHMRNPNRGLANPATHTSGGESACTENHVHVSSNISSFARKNIKDLSCSGEKKLLHKSPEKSLQKDVRLEKCCKCSKVPINVPSNVSKSARNSNSSVKRPSECLGSTENTVNIQNNIKNFSKRVVPDITKTSRSLECTKNNVIVPSHVIGSGKKQGSDSPADRSQSPGLLTNGCSKCLKVSGHDEVNSVAGGTLTSGAGGIKRSSSDIPTEGSGSPRKKIKGEAANSGNCITKTVPSVCDIEDIADLISKCRIHAPFEYYLKVVGSSPG